MPNHLSAIFNSANLPDPVDLRYSDVGLVTTPRLRLRCDRVARHVLQRLGVMRFKYMKSPMGDVEETVIVDEENVSSALTVNGIAVPTYRVDVLIEGEKAPVDHLLTFLHTYCAPHKARFLCVTASCHRAEAEVEM